MFIDGVIRHSPGDDIFGNEYADGVGNDDNETDVEKTYSKMRIRDLREKLNDMGLDIDGSREALIASLMEYSGS